MKSIINFIIRLFKQRNRGFSPSKTLRQIKREGDHYSDEKGELGIRFGASFKITNLGGQWFKWIPNGEIQKNNYFDTYGCTVFGTENSIQIYIKKEYDRFEEYSERYNGVLANLKIGFGGSPHNAAETVRKYGLLPYDKLPYDDTITTPQKFYSPKPMIDKLKIEGQKWLDKFEFGHDWFWNFSANNIMKMLEYSPLGVGIYAWVYDSAKEVYYKPEWATDNHWTTLVGYVKGKYWLIYDSYKVNGTFIKKIDWDYPFSFCKRYYINMKGEVQKTESEEGKKIYESVKKKHIMVTDTGEVYFVGLNYELKYEFWTTDSDWFQDVLDGGLRKKEEAGEFTGISREDFNKLKAAVILAGGRVYADENTIKRLKGLINELTNL